MSEVYNTDYMVLKNSKPRNPIRLFWGENYSPKPSVVKKAIERAVKKSIESIHLYPGSLYDDAVRVVAERENVSKDQIVFGHGVEGLIHTIYDAFLGADKTGGMFDPSFFVFENNLNRCRAVRYPCRYDGKVNINNFLKTIKDTDVFYLASPNTATGNYLLEHDEIEYVLKNYSGLFVVDECYFGIGPMSVVDLLPKFDNLLILRSLTKVMGMPALRLGFAMGNKPVIDKLKYHLTDIELDPINSFSLNIFMAVYPYFDLLVENTNRFFARFYDFMSERFPEDRIIKTYTTFYFFDITRYKVHREDVANYMNAHGYEFSSSTLTECPKGKYPQFVEITPPPREYWPDFVDQLQHCL